MVKSPLETRCGLNNYQILTQKYFSFQRITSEIENIEFSIMNRFFLDSMEMVNKVLGTKNQAPKELVDEFRSQRNDRNNTNSSLKDAIEEKLLIPALETIQALTQHDPRAKFADQKLGELVETMDLQIQQAEAYRDRLKATLQSLEAKDILN